MKKSCSLLDILRNQTANSGRVGEIRDGSIIEKLKEMLEEYIKKTEPEYYPPVEKLLNLIYEHYTENNPVEKNTDAGKAAKAKEKELEE